MKPEHEWLENVRGLLQEALPEAQDSLEPAAEGWWPDLCVRSKGATLMVEVKAVRAPRIAEVEGLLARAVLRWNRHAGSRGGIHVLVVALSRYGPRLAKAVREFMGEYAPNAGWGLLDQSDKAVLVIPELDLEWKRGPSLPEWRPSLFERRDRSLFTDLNRWMLKVLILRNAPEGQWGGPRQGPQHPTELAKIAGVSVSKAHHFASAFQQEGYLRKSGDGLRLVRLPALLDAWLQDERNTLPKMLPARSFLPAQTSMFPEEQRPEEPPLPPAAWGDSAIGGAFAAMHRGLLRVGGRQLLLVHVGKPMSRAMHEWQLESCDRRDAQLILSRPLYPRSVFRGIVRREHGAPLVDLWQVALDSVSSAARGLEQAEYIVERVLALQEDQ